MSKSSITTEGPKMIDIAETLPPMHPGEMLRRAT
jgi:hypothetical protein